MNNEGNDNIHEINSFDEDDQNANISNLNTKH